MNFIRERFGIYGLGFRWDSFIGLAIPIGFVLVIGGVLGFIVSGAKLPFMP